ncbi:hypothetical protein [Cerasicoccus arenae]|uniref:hypothetical protein n=1 Tax=Cerasicoccus arenae TaxID=424488 RepID=UPI00167C39AB|nr:hypothetical protein [Cerasicoccus arenae]MBK1857053.1 hypothetical protein [Cerasicoccus arenae]
MTEQTWLRERETFALRSSICANGYYRLETFSHLGHFPFYFSRENVHLEPFKFSFQDFDLELFNKLRQGSDWNFNFIFDTLYETLIKHHLGKQAVEDIHTIVALEGNDGTIFRHLESNDFDFSLIYMLRSAQGIMASISQRKPVEGIRSMMGDLGIDRKMVFEIFERQKVAKEYAARFPEKVLLINFEDVVNNPQLLHSKLQKFLNLPEDNPNWEPSLNGKSLAQEYGVEMFNQEIDSAEKKLTPEGIAMIKSWEEEFYAPQKNTATPSKTASQRVIHSFKSRVKQLLGI